MLDLLFVALLQAVTGEPAQAPAEPPTEQTSPSTPPAAEANPAVGESQPETVQCRIENVTASRVRRQRVCRTNAQFDRRTRDAQDGMRDNDLRGGPNPRGG